MLKTSIVLADTAMKLQCKPTYGRAVENLGLVINVGSPEALNLNATFVGIQVRVALKKKE